jgi:hypothetical protein
MMLKKFTITSFNESIQKNETTDILINPAHIVSMKPIKMTANDQRIIEVFWVRLSNGKKYKATRIPAQYHELLNEELPAIKYAEDSSSENHLQ